MRLHLAATEGAGSPELTMVPAPTWLREVLAKVLDEKHLPQFAELPEIVVNALDAWHRKYTEQAVPVDELAETVVNHLVYNFSSYFMYKSLRNAILDWFPATLQDSVQDSYGDLMQEPLHAEDKTWQQFFDEIDAITALFGIEIDETVDRVKDTTNPLRTFPVIVELIKRGYRLNDMHVNLTV